MRVLRTLEFHALKKHAVWSYSTTAIYGKLRKRTPYLDKLGKKSYAHRRNRVWWWNWPRTCVEKSSIERNRVVNVHRGTSQSLHWSAVTFLSKSIGVARECWQAKTSKAEQWWPRFWRDPWTVGMDHSSTASSINLNDLWFPKKQE